MFSSIDFEKVLMDKVQYMLSDAHGDDGLSVLIDETSVASDIENFYNLLNQTVGPDNVASVSNSFGDVLASLQSTVYYIAFKQGFQANNFLSRDVKSDLRSL